jgi:RNA polymerase sigma factor (sigma-70 family)
VPAAKPLPRCDSTAQQLAADNVRLAYLMARRSWRRCGGLVPLEDLTEEALVRLCVAAAQYNPARAKFSTFACNCIWRHLHHIVKQSTVRFRTRVCTMTDLTTLANLESEPPVDPACHRLVPAEVNVERRDLFAAARLLLPHAWWPVYHLYFGQGLNPTDCARVLGRSKERVRQLLAKIQARLRTHFREGRS